MKGLEKRLVLLETSQRGPRANLDHLSDAELDAYTLDVIQQHANAGVTLPPDWREQYDRSPVRFLEWLQLELKEMLACEG